MIKILDITKESTHTLGDAFNSLSIGEDLVMKVNVSHEVKYFKLTRIGTLEYERYTRPLFSNKVPDDWPF